MKNSGVDKNENNKDFSSKKRERSVEGHENIEEGNKNEKHSISETNEENNLAKCPFNDKSEYIKEEVNELKDKNVSKTEEPTKCLLITNLQRPFVKTTLESLLAKYGKITNLWLDYIKTHCYVEYEKINNAKDARDSLNGTVWPVDGKKLIIDFVPESEIVQAMEKNQSPFVCEKDKLAALKTQIKPNDNSQNINVNIPKPTKNNITEEEPVKTLDSLFKKTETKPHIYYLPLSELEVQEKRLKLNK